MNGPRIKEELRDVRVVTRGVSGFWATQALAYIEALETRLLDAIVRFEFKRLASAPTNEQSRKLGDQ